MSLILFSVHFSTKKKESSISAHIWQSCLMTLSVIRLWTYSAEPSCLSLFSFLCSSSKVHPGTEVTVVSLYNYVASLMPLWMQVQGFSRAIQSVTRKARDGVHLLCFSQGFHLPILIPILSYALCFCPKIFFYFRTGEKSKRFKFTWNYAHINHISCKQSHFKINM